jgi:hypothetical protein
MSLTGTRRIALAWILLSCGFSVLWGSFLERSSPVGMSDFKAVYYGARCLIQHRDPYKENEFLRVYLAEGGTLPSDPITLQQFRRAVPVFINLPTTLFLIAPLALLAWGPAHVLWILVLAAGLILAALLMWDLAERYAPYAALLLICIALANSELIFSSGRSALLAVSLCAVAVWSFLKERFVLAGVLCMAVSLVIKPHDAGLVWLYFLLAGGVYRKRALQTLLVVIVLSVPAILWVSQVSPHWIVEWRSNQSAISERGGLSDPGPTSISMRNPDRVIDLQTVISVFRDDPRIYNPATYLICGALLLVWSVRTLRSPFSQPSAWLALAAIAALSMLPIYHRQYDAKLLLLCVPACAMLWAEGGLIGWVALLMTTAGVTLTGDIPSAILTLLSDHLHVGTAGIFGQTLTVVLMRPAPLILLAIGIFYSWVFMRRDSDWTAPEAGGSNETPIAFRQA